MIWVVLGVAAIVVSLLCIEHALLQIRDDLRREFSIRQYERETGEKFQSLPEYHE